MDSADDPVQLVATLMSGFVDSRCVHVVANLGVADVVGEERMPIAGVAAELGVDEGSLTRLLRHLVTLGLFSIRGNSVAHNEASRLLRSDDPQGMLSMAQMMALPPIWDSARHLEDAVRTGRPGTTFLDQRGFFGYLADHPDESAVYDRGMTAMTARRIAAQVPAYDFSGSTSSPISAGDAGTSSGRSSTKHHRRVESCSTRPTSSRTRYRTSASRPRQEASSTTRCQKPTATCCPTSSMTGRTTRRA